MNLSTMDYFCVLAQEMSFTRAADKLNITQQTLSAHIAALERELNCKLFERTSPLKLTYAGEVFLSYAKRFQAQKRSLDQEFKDIAGEISGRLRVGITSTRGHIIMPRVIKEFRKLYPLVSVELHEAENIELIEALKTDELDVIVAHVPGVQPSLEVRQLYQDEIVMCVSVHLLESVYGKNAAAVIRKVRQTADLAYLEECPFMLVGKRDVSGEMARQAFERSGIKPAISVTSTNAETLLRLAEMAQGICFSPGELVRATYPEGSRADLRILHLGEDAFYPIHIAWKRADHLWRAIPAFCEVLDQQTSDTQWSRDLV